MTDKKIICSTHVDDLLCAATKNTSLLQDMSTHLSTVYDISITMDPTNHLGLVISRNRSTFSLTLTQPSYVAAILEKFSISVPDKPPRYPMHTDYLSTQSSDETPLYQIIFKRYIRKSWLSYVPYDSDTS